MNDHTFRTTTIRTILSLALASMFCFWPVNAAEFTTFESGQVRPLAMSEDGTRLYALNTPDNRLEIFSITPSSTGAPIVPIAAVEVGMEPVALAVRGEEVWVVNHLSDSISIVNVATGETPYVSRTLLVGDEPRDIVFAGPEGNRAFITAAHRGQNNRININNAEPDVQNVRGDALTPGTGRAQVWVFDADNLDASEDPASALRGSPLTVINLFGDRPRALAATADGTLVFAAVFRSGNRTATVHEDLVCDNQTTENGGNPADEPPSCDFNFNDENGMPIPSPGGLPAPRISIDQLTNSAGEHQAVDSGLIVQQDDDGVWRDELGRDWSEAVRFNLPDYDVFTINAAFETPAELTDRRFSGVGTVLFNMLHHSEREELYVSNTQANNRVRFEGNGDYETAGVGPKEGVDERSLRGNLHRSQISILTPDGGVEARHLNKHIVENTDFGYLTMPMPEEIKPASLATPNAMALSTDGETLYVAAFGSSKIGKFSVDELADDTFAPSPVDHIELPGGGPSGIVVDANNDRLYVLTRFNNSVIAIDLVDESRQFSTPMFNPEPDHVVDGRRFLYDARLSSSNGEASCASCHMYGDMDDLAWDLGNPDESAVNNFNLFQNENNADKEPFHALKGPMTTQSLRGLRHTGPLHWRGDRTGAAGGQVGDIGGDDPEPADSLDSFAGFLQFKGAFSSLLGLDNEADISDADMQSFAEFAMEISYPPNPIRALNGELRTGVPSEENGRVAFFAPGNDPSIRINSCQSCHQLNADFGFFGSSGLSANAGNTVKPQLKIPHFRNLYQKVGMFGFPKLGLADNGNEKIFDGIPYDHQGDQIRGFGYLHDGSLDSVRRLLQFGGFHDLSSVQKRDISSFLIAFDSNLASVIGQQATLRTADESDVQARVILMRNLAMQPRNTIDDPAGNNNDLIVKGIYDGEPFGGYMRNVSTNPNAVVWRFVFDRSDMPETAVLNDFLGWFDLGDDYGPFTFTAVPPGAGLRMGIDRDRDGVVDAQDSCPDDEFCPNAGIAQFDGEVIMPNVGGMPTGPQDGSLKTFGVP